MKLWGCASLRNIRDVSNFHRLDLGKCKRSDVIIRKPHLIPSHKTMRNWRRNADGSFGGIRAQLIQPMGGFCRQIGLFYRLDVAYFHHASGRRGVVSILLN